MDKMHRLLAALAEQMYRDVRFIAQSNPTQVVDEETARIFNALLMEVRKVFPEATAAVAFDDMSPRVLKYKDALVVVGQMTCLMKVLTGTDQPVAAPAPALGPPLGVPERRRELQVARVPVEVPRAEEDPDKDHDAELYGPRAPIHLNDDGTVKFSLDE